MDEADVRALLADIEDPDLGGDIVSNNLVTDVTVEGDTARVAIALEAPYSPTESAIAARVRDVLRDADLDPDLTAAMDTGRGDDQVLPGVQNIVAVASGKGGVGKSTVAVNLAAGLADRGARVGLFDADVYGPNVPRMVAADEHPSATEEETIVPPEKYGCKLMSMAFLVGEADPVIWRGPMVHSVLTQLIEDVEWGHLDYMVVDLPPGTGDTQLTMLQTVPLTGAVVVTTPQDVAIDDARKGLEMFGEHDTPVLGIAENMGSFRCPDCGSEHAIFGEGGGEAFAAEVEMPYLGSIPLDPAVRRGGDGGEPIVLGEGATADAFRDLTGRVADNVGVLNRRARL